MPRGREYLPHGLTAKEKADPQLRSKLSRCIKKVERTSCPMRAKKSDGTYDYAKCRYSPAAVCRESVEGLRSKKK